MKMGSKMEWNKQLLRPILGAKGFWLLTVVDTVLIVSLSAQSFVIFLGVRHSSIATRIQSLLMLL